MFTLVFAGMFVKESMPWMFQFKFMCKEFSVEGKLIRKVLCFVFSVFPSVFCPNPFFQTLSMQ